MNEIKCPKCGEAFTVDESGYIADDPLFNKWLSDMVFNLTYEQHV